ncbi:DcrB-related protein [Candidatus Eisenbacteria bacterium]|uniref:DcrB-related protein n=1 Tax=Eiseniibacteriota bacterium TaxID=2212470 RepID=A0ABV6YKA8_UNCEI
MITTNHRFQIELTEGWQDQTVHSFVGPEGEDAQLSLFLRVEPEPESSDLVQYAHTRRNMMISALPDLEVLKDEEVELPSGRPAYDVVGKWIHPDGRTLFRRYLFLLRDGVGFVFWSDLSKRTLRIYGPEIDAMVDTVEPIEQGD